MPQQSYNNTISGPNEWHYVTFDGVTHSGGFVANTVKHIGKMDISSTSTPNWRKLNKRERSLIRHNYDKVQTSLEEPNGAFVEAGTYIDPLHGVRNQTYFKNMNVSAMLSLSAWPDLAVTNSTWYGGDLTQQVDNKLLTKLSSLNQNSSSMVMFAEAHKTAAMFAQTATRIANALKHLRSGRFGDLTRDLGITATYETTRRYGKKRKKILFDLHMTDEKNGYMTATKRAEVFSDQKAMKTYGQRQEFQEFLSKTWLEFSYGWKPMLKDLDDSMKALAQHVVERENVLLHASATVKFENPNVFVTKSFPGYTHIFVRKESRTERLEVSYYKPDNILNAANNFGLLNPLEVAWEVVPFSFIADWFLPIGDSIRSLTSTVGLEFKGGSRTRRTKATAALDIFGNGISYPWNGAGSTMHTSGTAKRAVEVFEMKRTVLTSFPSAHFPVSKDWRSIAHGLSASALLLNLFWPGASGSARNLRT